MNIMIRALARKLVVLGLLAGLARSAGAEMVTYVAGGYDIRLFPGRQVDEFLGVPGQNELHIDRQLGSGSDLAAVEATTSPVAGTFMRLGATASTDALNPSPFALSLVYQSFRDRITYLGADTPGSLLLTFRFEGQLGLRGPLVGGPAAGADAEFGIRSVDSFSFLRTTTSSRPLASLDGVRLSSSYDVSVGGQALTLTSGSRLDFDAGSPSLSDAGIVDFAGDFTFAVTRKAGGTYDFGIMTYALNEISSMKGVTAFMDAGHTVGLTRVTLASGEVIDPRLLSFESGLRFSAVPEPSSLVMAGIGLMIGGGAWIGRRIRAA